MIAHTEKLGGAVAKALGGTSHEYQGRLIDFGKPFERLTMSEALRKAGVQGDLRDRALLARELDRLGVEHTLQQGWGALQFRLFEETAEKHLLQPTFVTEYPAEVSPLSRRSDAD